MTFEPTDDDVIPPGEVQEVLAELGLELSLEQATEVARLLMSSGDVERAIAALDDLLSEFDDADGADDDQFRRSAA